MNQLSKAAAILGKKGGESGTGEAKARSHAKAHASALKRFGYTGATDEECFWERVNRKSPDECWPWLGTPHKTGYGQWYFHGRQVYAHRQAFEYAKGTFDKTLDICHHCDNPICCNPKHLFAGTAKENIQDCLRKGRRIPAKGEGHGNAVLSEDLVKQLRKEHADGASLGSLGRKYHFGRTTIGYAIRVGWRHI